MSSALLLAAPRLAAGARLGYVPRMKPIPTELVFLAAKRTPFGT